MSNRELSTEFLASFQRASSEVAQSLGVSPLSRDDITQAQIALVKLRRALVQAAEFLPRYDQRQVDEQLKALEARLELKKASSAPKSRFTFRKAASVASRPALVPPPVPAPTPVPKAGPSTPTAGPNATDNVKLASLSQAYVTLPPELPSTGYSVSLSSLSHCIINLLPPSQPGPTAARPAPITALHIQNVTSCLLIAPDIEGSVLIDGFDGCALDVGCWQIRIHRARQTDVFVRMTGEQGTPVIEDCENIRFGPRVLGNASTLTLDPLTILDFSHPNPTVPSPNFRHMASGELDTLRQLVLRAATQDEAWTADRVVALLRDWEATRGPGHCQ